MIRKDFPTWRPIVASTVLILASACSAPQPRTDHQTPSKPKVVSIPIPAVIKPVPSEVPAPVSPWLRLRDRLVMHDCNDNPAVLKETRRYTRHPHRFNENWRKAMPLFLVVLDQVERHDLPGEFALLPYVESHYRQLPAKGRGPAGMWQLIERTAVDQGLSVSPNYDERLDALASTVVALRLLERYDRQFADWRLADLAFNAGEFRVKRALGNRRPKDLDSQQLAKLALSPVSHQHLARLMALACIISDPQRFSVSLPIVEDYVALEELQLPSAIDLRVAANLAEMPMDDLLRFNAAWSGQRHPHGPATKLWLPTQNADQLKVALENIPIDKLSDWHRHTIDTPTTLDAIGKRLNVTTATLARANRLDSDRALHTGELLLLPGRDKAANVDKSVQTHTIRRGDTLSAIAHRYGIRLRDLLRWNALTAKSILRTGTPLQIHAPTL